MNPSTLIGAPLAPTLARLAIPGTVGALIQSAMMMVEAASLRHAGTSALASVALVFPLVMLAAMFSAGAVGGAVSGAMARAMGAADSRQASAVLMAAMVLAVICGFAMGVLVLLFGPLLYSKTAQSAEVAAGAAVYSAFVFGCIPVLWLVNMLSAVLRGCGDMLRPAIVLAVMVASYALYARLLIPTTSVPVTGALQAAGIAMSLSYLTALVVCVYFVLRANQPVRCKLAAFSLPVTLAVLRQGLLASSQSLMTVAYALVATYLFSRHGTDWLAGYGLAVRLELIMVPITFGIGSSLIAMVGAHVGAGLQTQAVSIAWRGVLANAVIVGLLGLCIAVWPEVWCDNLASSTEVANLCGEALRVVGPTYGFFALGLCSYFASQALNTLIYPVTGAAIRLFIVATGLLWYSAEYSPQLLLYLIATAVIAYGLFVVIALRLGPWHIDKR